MVINVCIKRFLFCSWLKGVLTPLEKMSILREAIKKNMYLIIFIIMLPEVSLL